MNNHKNTRVKFELDIYQLKNEAPNRLTSFTNKINHHRQIY